MQSICLVNMHWLLARLSSKDKRGITLVNTFEKITPKGRKPNNINNIWVDQDAEFYNNFLWKFLKINNIEMYSTYNEGKSVAAERFIATLKNKIFKHMISVSSNVYFNVLVAIISKYKDTVHRSQLTLYLILMLNTMKILIKKILN